MRLCVVFLAASFLIIPLISSINAQLQLPTSSKGCIGTDHTTGKTYIATSCLTNTQNRQVLCDNWPGGNKSADAISVCTTPNATNLASSPTLPAIVQIVLAIIGVGGLATVGVETARDFIIKRREEYLDVSKTKMEKISNSVPYYGLIGTYYGYFTDELTKGKERLNPTLCLYYTCIIVRTLEENTRNIGGVQLDNLDAEDVVGTGMDFLNYLLVDELGYIDVNIMASLVKDNIDYNEFLGKLSDNYNAGMDDRFKKWLMQQDIGKLKESFQRFNQVLQLEINHCFNLWYGEEPSVGKLKTSTIEFLKVNYPKYFARITSFQKTKILERIKWKKPLNNQIGPPNWNDTIEARFDVKYIRGHQAYPEGKVTEALFFGDRVIIMSEIVIPYKSIKRVDDKRITKTSAFLTWKKNYTYMVIDYDDDGSMKSVVINCFRDADNVKKRLHQKMTAAKQQKP